MKRPKPISSNPHVMKVIRTEVREGKGTEDNPCRVVIYFHTLDGQFLAKRDELKDWQLSGEVTF